MSRGSNAGPGYRPEIDGLRALAVLPVVFFHAGFSGFEGGFVGVDVFFVISGYLITSIISKECARGHFSLAKFYERRARRILPALFVVLAACLPLAWLWMLPVQIQALTRSMVAAVVFVPNLYFWSTTQYFGTAAEELPLLHTWSLGVEEQFYVVFPLMVWALWRRGARVVVIVTCALALASFGLSEWAWRHGKLSSDFFFPFTRDASASGKGARRERLRATRSRCWVSGCWSIQRWPSTATRRCPACTPWRRSAVRPC
jgi:peptidoglycan/LPS O-acetylase OafA/YrhL